MKIIFMCIAVLLCIQCSFGKFGNPLKSAISSGRRATDSLKNIILRINSKVQVVSPKSTFEDEISLTKRQDRTFDAYRYSLSFASLILYLAIIKMNLKNRTVAVRVVFCSYLILSQLLNMTLTWFINKRDDNTAVQQTTATPIAMLLASVKTTTAKAHDLEAVRILSNSLLMNAISGLYLYFMHKNTLLLIQTLGIFQTFKSPLFAIYFLRMKAVGKLSRPFKSAIEETLALLTEWKKYRSLNSSSADSIKITPVHEKEDKELIPNTEKHKDEGTVPGDDDDNDIDDEEISVDNSTETIDIEEDDNVDDDDELLYNEIESAIDEL